jgi:hypothetical protein
MMKLSFFLKRSIDGQNSEIDYFIRCVLTILLCVLYYGCFNHMFCNMCKCFYNMYILTFSVLCLCTYLHCFVVLCIFIFVYTSVGLLPPGESPVAVSSSSSSNNNNNIHHRCQRVTSLDSVTKYFNPVQDLKIISKLRFNTVTLLLHAVN